MSESKYIKLLIVKRVKANPEGNPYMQNRQWAGVGEGDVCG